MVTKEENLRRLEDLIDSLDFNSKTLVIFDFDELIIPSHLAKEVTGKISDPVDEEKLNKLGAASFEGIKYLRSLFQGYDYSDYEKARDSTVSQTPFREGFKETVLDLQEESAVLVLTLAPEDICYSKLKEITFHPTKL